MEAEEGRESDVEKFLDSGLALVDEEPATTAWFALRLGGSRSGVDVFPVDAGRDTHLFGKVAETLMARAPDLFSRPPTCSQEAPAFEKVDVIAAKRP
jgi:hypothetical protein